MPTAWEREQERERKARYLAEREAETGRRNKLIGRRLSALDNILSDGVSNSVALDHNTRKLPPPVFDAGELDVPYEEPTPEDFFPPEPGTLARIVPGWRNRYEAQQVRAEEEFNSAHAEWQHLEKQRNKQRRQLAERDKRHQQAISEIQQQHLRMNGLATDARTGKQYAVEDYLRHTLESSNYPRGFPRKFGLRYLPSRKDLLMEYELPVARDVIQPKSLGSTSRRGTPSIRK